MIALEGEAVEPFAVVDETASGDPGHPHAMIASLASNDTRTRAFAAHPMPGDRDLHCGICCFRSRIGEEDMIQIAGRERRDLRGRFEGLGMAELEARREIQRGSGVLNGLDDGSTAMTGVAAPKSRRRVEDAPAVLIQIIHALGARDDPRLSLEFAVRREGKPKGVKLVDGWVGHAFIPTDMSKARPVPISGPGAEECRRDGAAR